MLTLNVNELETNTQDNHGTNNVRTMIETSKPSAALEDYIEELKQRQTSQQRSPDQNVDDRERDLILAAELGKALLERNEQLTLANESITEQYSQKLEQLEQEKHSLRRKLDILQDDYESRVLELKNDIANYRKRLVDQQDTARQMEKSESKVVQELIEQNERLTTQLKQSSEQEELLSNQLISLREHVSVRKLNFSDHVAQLEGLKEEINLLNKRKNDLEKRINLLNVEREQLQISLEESNQKCLLLEQRCTHHAAEANRAQRELEETRRQLCASQHYTTPPSQRKNREQLSPPSSCSSVNGQPTSLFNELMSCDGDSDDLNKTQNSHLDKNGNQILDLTMLTESSDEIECDITDEECDWKLKSELLAMYHSMRTVCAELNRRKEDRNSLGPISAQDSGVSESPISELQLSSALLQQLRKEFKNLFNNLLTELDDQGPCTSCKQLLSERNETIKLRKDYQQQTDELKKTREELTKLQSKLTIMETELTAAKEEQRNLAETANVSGLLNKEEIVKRAFELRDQAVHRKNQVEIELAKTRIECMQINSQLIEAIQQKVELSQQLDQWQVDMQSLLNEQLRSKLTSEEQEAKQRKAQLNSSNQSSPGLLNSKNSITANLIQTGTINKNKFLRLFMSNKSSTNKQTVNDKSAKTTNTVNTNASKTNTLSNKTSQKTAVSKTLTKTNSFIGRNKTTNTKSITTISGNTRTVNVSS